MRQDLPTDQQWFYFKILDWKFQRLATRMEITIQNGRTWSSMCFANKLLNFGWNICCFGFPANTINLKCVTYNLRKGNLSEDFGRVYKLAGCFQEVFHTTWEKKSFHFRKCTENTQRKTFSMKFSKITYSYKRSDSKLELEFYLILRITINNGFRNICIWKKIELRPIFIKYHFSDSAYHKNCKDCSEQSLQFLW